MKEEINAAAGFLSRIFLTHDNVSKEKVEEFNQHLCGVLQERFRDHWHETCPTKGQAYRCIRICPEEPLDPLLEKVCHEVGINTEDFNLPMELTLWVDPKEVVCKFGDLKCTYHTVAKKDQSSGTLDNQTEHLDIDDLVENARDLYLKKQTVVIHPINSSEMHIQNPYNDASSNGFTMAVRINGTMHYNMSGSPPTGYDGSPRGKGKPPHSSHHKRGTVHYYGKGPGGKGSYIANGTGGHAQGSHHGGGNGNGFPHHHNHHQQQQQHHHPHSHHHHHHAHHHPHHHHHHTQGNSGFQNGYQEENGYVGFDQRAVSPSKMNGCGLPPMPGGGPPMTQSSPTPEQIQQQMQHPPPIPPPPIPNQLQQPFGHPPTDTSSLPPPPPVTQQPPSSSSVITSTNSNISSGNSSNIGGGGGTNISNSNGKMSNSNNHGHGGGSNGKYQGNRGSGPRGGNGVNRQGSPAKEMKHGKRSKTVVSRANPYVPL